MGCLPYLRLMASFPQGFQASEFLPRKWSQVWQGEARSEERPDGMGGQTTRAGKPSEDAIEDESQNGDFLGGDW